MRHFVFHIIILTLITACSADEIKVDKNIQKADSLDGKQLDLRKASYLLTNSINMDQYEHHGVDPFIYFKSGNILTDEDKHAVIIQSSVESTFMIELYQLTNEQWMFLDRIETQESNHLQFHTIFADYNFDNINDLYIQQTASNGYVMSRGHLITFDRENRKLILHPEVRDEANLTPDSERKIVLADELIQCKKALEQEVCKRKFEWVNSELIKRDRKCPCESR